MNIRATAVGRAAFIATVALVGAGFALGGAHAAVGDSLKVTVGGAAVVDFNAADEGAQSFSALQVAAFPEGFKPGTLYLIEPAAEGAGSELTGLGEELDLSRLHVSDALSLNGSLLTGKFNVFFISDGASAADRRAFPTFATVTTMPERGSPMDVSSVFGFPTGSIIVQSDIPEPAAWAMMLIGFGGVGVVLRRRRAHAGLQTA